MTRAIAFLTEDRGGPLTRFIVYNRKQKCPVKKTKVPFQNVPRGATTVPSALFGPKYNFGTIFSSTSVFFRKRYNNYLLVKKLRTEAAQLFRPINNISRRQRLRLLLPWRAPRTRVRELTGVFPCSEEGQNTQRSVFIFIYFYFSGLLY